MKVDRILKDMIKDYFNDYDNSKFRFKYGYDMDDYNIFLLVNSTMIYIIPKNNFILDTDKVFKNCTRFTAAKKMFYKYYEAIDTEYVYDKQVEMIKKYNLKCYQIVQNEEVISIDSNLLKYFEEPFIKATDNKNPAYVYENDTLVGLVLPFVKKHS